MFFFQGCANFREANISFLLFLWRPYMIELKWIYSRNKGIWVIPWETGPLKIFTSPILVKHSGYLYWVKLWWATKFFGIWTIFGYPSGQFSKMAVFGQKMTENWPFFKSDIDTSFLMTHRAVICLKKALGTLFQYNVHLFT